MKYQIDVQQVRNIQQEIWNSIRGTFELRKGYGEPLPIFGHYGGVFKCGRENLIIHTDGVGTKLILAQQMEKYDTVGIDAIAMSVNDILCLGAESLVGVDYIALPRENTFLVAELMKGLVEGATQSNCAIIGGETAIVPDLLKDDKTFDLTFTVVGRVIHRPLTGKDSRKGDVILGLASSGLHSNGYTLARKVLPVDKWGKEMLEPTKIYVKPVLSILNSELWKSVKGMAHITGGAFSKVSRLSKNVGFLFNDLPKMSPMYEALYAEVQNIEEMHKTFNMGIGMAMVVKRENAEEIKNRLNASGVSTTVIGEIIKESGVFIERDGKRFKV
ncbi:MAG: phosphoribosylformylglycinamidine cyclo-ligase [Candidatus Micrarchaeota archaeon]|nr:phosphoribosylformylglycinamidine cyclo-ligase [Candidatus Micrarchaeota archaeon]